MIIPLKSCFDCGSAFVPSTGNSKRCRPCARARLGIRDKAVSQVNSAIKCGRLVRQPCEVCGKVKVDAHHDDYSQPLVVRWLCRAHHQQHHAIEYGVRITKAKGAA